MFLGFTVLKFLKKGVLRRDGSPDLAGGGLVRSAGGWSALRSMRKAETRMKGEHGRRKLKHKLN
jgi:REP-associated tyrosine transposase